MAQFQNLEWPRNVFDDGAFGTGKEFRYSLTQEIAEAVAIISWCDTTSYFANMGKSMPGTYTPAVQWHSDTSIRKVPPHLQTHHFNVKRVMHYHILLAIQFREYPSEFLN